MRQVYHPLYSNKQALFYRWTPIFPCVIIKLVLPTFYFSASGVSPMGIQSINPATGEVLETFELFSQEQIDEALDQARQAFLSWRSTSFTGRAAHLLRVARYLREHKAELGRLAVLE